MFLFPIEVSNRELIPKLYLALKFAETGKSSFVGQKAKIWGAISHIKNPIYFDKGYHKGESEKIYKKIKNNDGIIISLDEENGVDLRDNSTLNHRFTEYALNTFDLIFLWGSAQFDYLKQNRNNFSDKKTFAYGHTRFELLTSEFQSIYTNEVKAIQEKYGDFILINTSFGFGNNILGEKFVIKNYESRISSIKKKIIYEKEQLSYFIELIKKLKGETKLKIVIRPHPEEDKSIYDDTFANEENITVIYEGSVIQWLLASRVMIHHSCTTAIEARMLGKNPISFGKNFNHSFVPWIPIKLSKVFDDIGKLVEYVKDGKQVGMNKSQSKILDRYFSFNLNSSDKIVKKVNLLYPLNNNFHRISIFKFFLYSNFKLFMRKYIIELIISKRNQLFKNKFKGFDYDSILSYHKLLMDKGFIDKNVKIRFWDSQLFEVYNSKNNNKLEK